MLVTFPHGLCHREPKEAPICKAHTLVVVSVERNEVDGGARELVLPGRTCSSLAVTQGVVLSMEQVISPQFFTGCEV